MVHEDVDHIPRWPSSILIFLRFARGTRFIVLRSSSWGTFAMDTAFFNRGLGGRVGGRWEIRYGTAILSITKECVDFPVNERLQ